MRSLYYLVLNDALDEVVDQEGEDHHVEDEVAIGVVVAVPQQLVEHHADGRGRRDDQVELHILLP